MLLSPVSKGKADHGLIKENSCDNAIVDIEAVEWWPPRQKRGEGRRDERWEHQHQIRGKRTTYISETD